MESSFPKPLFIQSLTRSPIGKFGGSLMRFSAPELAALTLREAVARNAGAPDADGVILGHARQAGAGPNPARQASLAAGLATSIPALTVNQACASGLSAVFAACEKISAKRGHAFWAGGVESMSNTPYLVPKARWGIRMGHAEIQDGMHQDGFFCPMSQMLMGATVENFLVPEFKISRQEQDEFALASQHRAEAAWAQGLFKHETFEIPPDGKKPGLGHDEHRRSGSTREGLAKLSPVFDTKTGTITAGNSSGITDGAAWVFVSDQKTQQTKVEIIDYETVAIEPKRMGLGPVPAIENLLRRQKLKTKDIDAFEINEAFAAQVIACQRSLNISPDRLNAWGGAIAIGHPIGASACRILVTLGSRLNGKTGALGVAAACVSGGHGVAILVRAV